MKTAIWRDVNGREGKERKGRKREKKREMEFRGCVIGFRGI